jgi:hypothetical protein
MSDGGRLPLATGWAATYEVSADQRMARLHLPALRLAGVSKPVNILRQLAEIRAQMLPALRRN